MRILFSGWADNVTIDFYRGLALILPGFLLMTMQLVLGELKMVFRL